MPALMRLRPFTTRSAMKLILTDILISKYISGMDATQARAIGSACLCLQVRKAARRVGRLFDEALSPVGLTNGQFSLITMLAARDDWTMQALADALSTDQSSLTAALKPLERRGLVRTGVSGNDRRVRTPALTPAGTALLDKALPLWRTAQARAEAQVGGPGAERLRRDLSRLT